MIATAFLLFTSAFFTWPKDLSTLFAAQSSKSKGPDSSIAELIQLFEHRRKLVSGEFEQMISRLVRIAEAIPSQSEVEEYRRERLREVNGTRDVAESTRVTFLRLCTRLEQALTERHFAVAHQITRDIHSLLNTPEVDSLFVMWHRTRLEGTNVLITMDLVTGSTKQTHAAIFHPRVAFFQSLPDTLPADFAKDVIDWQLFSSSNSPLNKGTASEHREVEVPSAPEFY